MILTLAAQSRRLSHMCTRKSSGVFNGIRTHDLCDGGAYMSREILSSKCEDRFFNSALNHTSQAIISLLKPLNSLGIWEDSTAALVRWTLELCQSFTNCISFYFFSLILLFKETGLVSAHRSVLPEEQDIS